MKRFIAFSFIALSTIQVQAMQKKELAPKTSETLVDDLLSNVQSMKEKLAARKGADDAKDKEEEIVLFKEPVADIPKIFAEPPFKWLDNTTFQLCTPKGRVSGSFIKLALAEYSFKRYIWEVRKPYEEFKIYTRKVEGLLGELLNEQPYPYKKIRERIEQFVLMHYRKTSTKFYITARPKEVAPVLRRLASTALFAGSIAKGIDVLNTRGLKECVERSMRSLPAIIDGECERRPDGKFAKEYEEWESKLDPAFKVASRPVTLDLVSNTMLSKVATYALGVGIALQGIHSLCNTADHYQIDIKPTDALS